jgi:hypothetical protein
VTTFLMRSAVVAIGQPPAFFDLEVQLGPVTVATTRPVMVEGKPAGVLCVAYVPLSKPLVATLGKVVIPDEERQAAEFAIETTARLMALDFQSSHSVSSPMPFIGFWSDDAAALDALDGVGVDQPLVQTLQGARGRHDLLTPEVLSALSDRFDGVALLSEALNNPAPLGRYMQLMRLFERAFATGPHALTQPLATLLGPCGEGFELAEVQGWTDARGPAAHADRRAEFFLSADVQRFVPRMVQAGYDVLLNKADWRSKSSERRKAWRLKSGSNDPSSGIFITKGAEASLVIEVLDGFAAYPVMLAGPVDEVVPPGVWLHAGVDGGALRRTEGSETEPPAGLGHPRGGPGERPSSP